MALRDEIQIMVVDDMATSRGLILQALDQIGCHHTTHASDASRAYHEILTKRIHLVISDFNMPGMDGLGLLKSLRENPATRRIGFILITGSPDANLIARGRALGMNNFLKKPFGTVEMKACLEAVVGRL